MEELTLKEIQNESLKILIKVDEICNNLQLNYCLMYGTLIGAIRHNGFIPWDDDIDIAMPRKDYNKLMQYFKNNEDKLRPFEFFSKENRLDYPYMIGRICNTEFKMVAEFEKDYGMGTFIDVYPMDGAGNGNADFLYIKSRLLSSIYFMKSRTVYQAAENKFLNFFKKFLFILSHFISKESLRKKLEKLTTIFDYEMSEYVTQMDCCTDGKKNIYRKNDLFETEYHTFEGYKVKIPKNYDKVLRGLYGDYMKLPPEEKRVGHHFYSIYRK